MIQGTYNASFPNPRYYGLKGKFWSTIQRKVDELADIRDRAAQAGMRSQELQRERDFQQRQYEDALVASARSGADDPDDSQVEAVKRAIEKAEAKMRAAERAAGEVTSELLELMKEGVPAEVLAELREQGRQHEDAYHEYVAKAQAERDALGQAYALHLWARGLDPNGQPPFNVDSAAFRGTPLSPAPDSSQWYEHALSWGDEQEMSDAAITVVSSSGFVS